MTLFRRDDRCPVALVLQWRRSVAEVSWPMSCRRCPRTRGSSFRDASRRLRRPPAAGVLMALALQPRQVTRPLSAVLDPAHRSGTLSRLELRPLTRGEAGLLLGATIDDSRANALYDESGGNPLYLEQLSRPAGVRPQEATSAAEPPGGFEVPPMVAVALTVELASLSETARRMLEGAAVVGDPFELDLATEAAALTEAMAMESLDELMALDLVRHTSVPRRFEFRHPLVRHAVYEAMPGGWRLAAHKRSAEALGTRGAQVAGRAHHLAQSAPHGDLAAVAVLSDAGEAAARLAPASAARWFAQALRLLPLTASSEQRVQLLYARGKALTAAGHFTDSHDCLLEAIAMFLTRRRRCAPTSPEPVQPWSSSWASTSKPTAVSQAPWPTCRNRCRLRR
jgi:hypothetical protein